MPTRLQLTIGVTCAVAAVIVTAVLTFCHHSCSTTIVNDPLARSIDSTHWIRAYIADEIITINVAERNMATLLSDVKESLQQPLDPVRLPGPSVRVDFLDSAENLLLSGEVYGRHLILAGRHFRFEKEPVFLRPFAEACSRKIYYHSNGMRRADGVHDKGKKHGHWIYYYSNGKKESEGNYEWGCRVGRWTTWDESGVPKLEQDFESLPTSPLSPATTQGAASRASANGSD